VEAGRLTSRPLRRDRRGEEAAMIATFVATVRLVRMLGRALADPATRGIVFLAGAILLIGTVFYANAEGWRWLDALYFSVITLTTIGFGDVVPTSDGAKLFTVVYSLVGIGIIAAFVTSLALFARDDAAVRPERLIRRRRRTDE
jgi:voltage-gated potassium channel